MKRSSLFAAALCAVFAASPAVAHDFTAGALKIVHPWARATPKSAPVGGGYLTITNTGTTPDRFVSGTSDVAKGFEIHEMSMEGGIMKMRPLPNGVEIKPGQTVTFKPGGYHVMFTGLRKPLEKGQRVNATLQFEKAGKVDVYFTVEAIGAPAAAGHDGHMQMKH